MNLPVEIKRLVVDYIFFKKEPYAQGLPADAIKMAVRDLKQLTGLRALCNGDAGFLSGRFKTMKANDRETVAEGRVNLLRAIAKFKHYDCQVFSTSTAEDAAAKFDWLRRKEHRFIQ
jgi:hypothetical protein